MLKRPNTSNLLDGYHRKRPYYGLLVVLTIGAGLLSRTPYVPALLYPYIGDVLYALMMYFLVGFCAIRATPLNPVYALELRHEGRKCNKTRCFLSLSIASGYGHTQKHSETFGFAVVLSRSRFSNV